MTIPSGPQIIWCAEVLAPHAGCAYHQERMINVAAWFHLVLLVLLFSLILVQLLILFIPFILFRSMLPPPPPSPPSAFFWLHSDDIGAPIFIIFIHPILKASGEVGTGGIVDLSQSIIYYSIRSTDHLVRRSISAACRMRVSSGEDDKCSSLVLSCFVGVILLSSLFGC